MIKGPAVRTRLRSIRLNRTEAPDTSSGWNEFDPNTAPTGLGCLVCYHALVGRAIGAGEGFAALGRRARNALSHVLVSALRLLAAPGPASPRCARPDAGVLRPALAEGLP